MRGHTQITNQQIKHSTHSDTFTSIHSSGTFLAKLPPPPSFGIPPHETLPTIETTDDNDGVREDVDVQTTKDRRKPSLGFKGLSEALLSLRKSSNSRNSDRLSANVVRSNTVGTIPLRRNSPSPPLTSSSSRTSSTASLLPTSTATQPPPTPTSTPSRTPRKSDPTPRKSVIDTTSRKVEPLSSRKSDIPVRRVDLSAIGNGPKPTNASVTPRRESSITPRISARNGNIPTPRNTSNVTPRTSVTPRNEKKTTPRSGNLTPRNGNVTPRNGNVTPRNGNITPRNGNGNVTPRSGNATPRTPTASRSAANVLESPRTVVKKATSFTITSPSPRSVNRESSMFSVSRSASSLTEHSGIPSSSARSTTTTNSLSSQMSVTSRKITPTSGQQFQPPPAQSIDVDRLLEKKIGTIHNRHTHDSREAMDFLRVGEVDDSVFSNVLEGVEPMPCISEEKNGDVIWASESEDEGGDGGGGHPEPLDTVKSVQLDPNTGPISSGFLECLHTLRAHSSLNNRLLDPEQLLDYPEPSPELSPEPEFSKPSPFVIPESPREDPSPRMPLDEIDEDRRPQFVVRRVFHRRVGSDHAVESLVSQIEGRHNLQSRELLREADHADTSAFELDRVADRFGTFYFSVYSPLNLK
eukprot:c2090_g1_i1.p1 GENE.c2090_g1_i1~~c2090_g1_i1.p1  ORF type:complete len:657 (+),score=187.78 c2090_g1_i1:63-1973(+)